MADLTKVQEMALTWLSKRGGSGVFDNNGVLIAAGDQAPFMRSTWNALRDAGLIAFSNPAGRSYGRASILPP